MQAVAAVGSAGAVAVAAALAVAAVAAVASVAAAVVAAADFAAADDVQRDTHVREFAFLCVVDALKHGHPCEWRCVTVRRGSIEPRLAQRNEPQRQV